MAKLAYLLVAALAIAGCEKNNLEYCNNHSADFCPDDGRPSEPMGCTSNADCKSAAAPLCDVGGDKTCVQCLTAGENTTECTEAGRPICDDRACRACTAHSDCGSQLCLPNGTCAAEGTIAYMAGPGDGGTDNTDCSKTSPCTKVQRALDKGRVNLKMHGAIDDAANINRTVDIYADPGTTLTRATNGTILTISGSSTVTINDLAIQKAHNTNANCIETRDTSVVTLNRVSVSEAIAHGILCGGKTLTVNRSTIFKNPQLGINCTSGTLIVNASKIYKNDGGGIATANTVFDITNSVIVHNGTTTSSVGGVSLGQPPAATVNRFEFNTVADNEKVDSAANPAGVICDIAGLLAPNNLISHNKLGGDSNRVVANINSILGCAYPTTAVATSNTDFKFVNPDNEPYDYSLQSGSSAIDKATTPSAITVDYKGTTRPQGASKDQGADEYKP